MLSLTRKSVTLGGSDFDLALLERHGIPGGETSGEKSTDLILFIHGLGCEKASFAFAHKAASVWGQGPLANATLLAPDLPGHGESPVSADFSCSMEDHAAVLRALLDSYEFDRLHIVAHSMGGAIGLLLAENHDLPLKSFINVEGNLYTQDGGLLSRKSSSYDEDIFVAEKYQNLLARADGQGPDMQLWAEWGRICDPRAFYRSAVSLVKWSDSGELGTIFKALDCAKAYIHGETSANMAVISRLEGPEGGINCIEIPGAGHFVMTDAPDVFHQTAARIVSTATAL